MANGTPQEIYERRHSVTLNYEAVRDLMTDAEYERGQYYRNKYLNRRGETDGYKEEFERVLKLYECRRDPDPTDQNYPNNFVPMIAPIIEGQIASMMENDVDYIYSSNNPAHQQYLPKLESASAYCREMNKAHLHFKDYARSAVTIGNAWLTVFWEKSYSTAKNRPQGYPRIMVPPVMSVLVDGRIKDYKDLQHAEYIIHELGFQDIAWARKEYGDEKASCIARTLNRYDGIDTEASTDDNDTFMLLHVWTRDNEQGNLQLIEMDSTGFILRVSDPKEAYYKTVDNEYPFYFGRMMPRQGKFYGLGDGQLLEYMQTYINRLCDEMELACRFNAQPKTYIDSRSGFDVDEFDSDPSHPILVDNPHQNVYVVQGQGINPVVPQTIQMNLDQAQRATRFSDIMTGNQQGVSATATQISGQLAQGTVGIKDKASDIQNAMAWCDRYCVRLCLENWDIPFWVSKFRNSEEYEFIDMKSMAQVPAVVPPSGQTAKRRIGLRRSNPKIPVVGYETVKNGEEDSLIDLDFNVKVSLATGFPRGKNDLFNQIVSLMQMNPINPETGAMEPFVDLEVARSKMEQILGFKIRPEKAPEAPKPIIENAGMINPLGNSGEVAQPQGSQVQTQPSNLMGTMPMARDNRGMSV